MILRGVQCDECPSYFDTGDLQSMYDFEPPQGWLTVFQGKLLGAKPKHFCSDACLSGWLVKRATATGEHASEEEVNSLLPEGCIS